MMLPLPAPMPALIRPGSRYVVKYRDQEGWHERIVLHRLAEEDYVVITPHGDKYLESRDDYEHCHLVTGTSRYPPSVTGNVTAFAEPVEDGVLRDAVLQARTSCLSEQARLGLPSAPATDFLGWDGETLSLPDPPGRWRSLLPGAPNAALPRRRLARKQSGTAVPRDVEDGAAFTGEASESRLSAHAVEAPPGHTWVLVDTELCAARPNEFKLGAMVTLGARSRVYENMALGQLSGGTFGMCRLMLVGEVPSFADRARGLLNVPAAEKEVDLEYGVEDSRTLWVDENAQGTREKEFRVAVRESYQEPLRGSELKGTPGCLHVCKMMESTGGKPSEWLSNFCRKKHLDENHAVFHELTCLTQALEDAACYDQFNLGGSLALETISRRVTAIAEALSKGAGSSNWSQAKEIYGRDPSDSLLSAERRAEVSKTVRENLEIEALRARASGAQRANVVTDDKFAAVELGAFPNLSVEPPAGKGNGKRAKARAKAALKKAGADGG